MTPLAAHAAPPPVGLVDGITWPFSLTASQNDAVGHDTALMTTPGVR